MKKITEVEYFIIQNNNNKNNMNKSLSYKSLIKPLVFDKLLWRELNEDKRAFWELLKHYERCGTSLLPSSSWRVLINIFLFFFAKSQLLFFATKHFFVYIKFYLKGFPSVLNEKVNFASTIFLKKLPVTITWVTF